jgi:predicted protein tyrosine phosphatase
MTIWVTSRFQAPLIARRLKVQKAVSLLAPWDEFPNLALEEDTAHLRLSFDDIDLPQEGMQPPQPEHVEKLIRFVTDWDREKPLLIHCWAGVSRSSASAFITACLHNPDADEFEIARMMRKASDTAKPNRRLIRFADEILQRDGRMIEAVAAMSPNQFTEEAVPFSIPSRFDALHGHWV